VDMLWAARTRYRTALATNRTISAHEILAHFRLDQYFDLVVTASDVQHPKPHPEAMERIQQVFGVTPGQVLYVGDSPVDESFAESAGSISPLTKSPSQGSHPSGPFQELYNRILHPNIDRSPPAGGHGNPA